MLVKSLLSLVLIIAPLQIARGEPSRVAGSIECDDSDCSLEGLSIRGPINETTLTQFTRLIDETRQRSTREGRKAHLRVSVDLRSPGGSVSHAIAIGRIMRKERMRARVAEGVACNSACVLIYAGAVVRQNFGARIGIHQPYLEVPTRAADSDELRKRYTAVLIGVKAYFREMNVSEQLADEMLRISPSDVRYLSVEEQARFGLTPEDPVELEVSSVEHAQRLGLDRAEYNRRDALKSRLCTIELAIKRGAQAFSDCYDSVMTTGKPPASPDLSSSGTLVK